jgi:hypothetical protein
LSTGFGDVPIWELSVSNTVAFASVSNYEIEQMLSGTFAFE